VGNLYKKVAIISLTVFPYELFMCV